LAAAILTPWHIAAGGVRVRVKAEPRSRRPGVQGITDTIDGPALRIGVTAAPEDGRATEAIAAILAKIAGCAPSQVTLLRGASSRQKLFAIAGDAAKVIHHLAQAVAPTLAENGGTIGAAKNPG
jgi:uncharacterized protein YggU (UPF0235/DUF167 family)